MYEAGDIKTFNPQKEISREIVLEILIRHRDALKQARTGELVGATVESLRDNGRKLNQARALNLIVAAQKEMITISRPIIFYRATQLWKKKNREDEDKKKNPFEKEDNDYNKLVGKWRNFLTFCEQAILEADRTKSLDDDFLITKQTNDGDVNELTENFYEMVEDLEDSYEQIYLLMLINKIVSAGIEEDEESTYKEKEAEMVRRVVEA